MARPTGSCPPGRKPLLSDRETALGRRSFRPSPCRGRHPSSPRRRGGSNIHSYFWPMWLKYSFPLVAQILVPTWLKYSLTFTNMGGEGEGVQRATADFVCFHCPLEPAEKTNIIGKDSRIPCAQSFARGFSLFSPQRQKNALDSRESRANRNPAATYPPGPCPAKYFQHWRA